MCDTYISAGQNATKNRDNQHLPVNEKKSAQKRKITHDAVILPTPLKTRTNQILPARDKVICQRQRRANDRFTISRDF